MRFLKDSRGVRGSGVEGEERGRGERLSLCYRDVLGRRVSVGERD
jgi:hypothetical protein